MKTWSKQKEIVFNILSNFKTLDNLLAADNMDYIFIPFTQIKDSNDFNPGICIVKVRFMDFFIYGFHFKKNKNESVDINVLFPDHFYRLELIIDKIGKTNKQYLKILANELQIRLINVL